MGVALQNKECLNKKNMNYDRKSERKLSKNGFSTNKMQTQKKHLFFTIFAILLVYIKKK